MNRNPTIIYDKSPAYLGFRLDLILSEWGVNKRDTLQVKSLGEAGVNTLFGDTPVAIVKVDSGEAAKAAVRGMSRLKPKELLERFESGLIITSSADRRSCSALESMIKSMGGDVVLPPGKKDEPLSIRMVKELGLKPAVRDFLLSYVGQDYEAVLPLLRSLSELSVKQRKIVTEEDIYNRMPQAPGSVPPWEVDTHIFAGNVSKAVDIAHRVNRNASYLVWMSIVKKKVSNAYRTAVLLQSSPNISDDELSSHLGIPRNQVYFIKKHARSVGLVRLESAVKLIAATEAQVKGGSAAPGEALSDVLLVRLCGLLGSR